MDFAFGVVAKNSLPKLRLQKFLSSFSSRSLIVWDFTFRSMIHFQLMLVYGIRYASRIILFCFANGYIAVPAPLIKKTILVH